MNYFTLMLFALAGIVLGLYFGRKRGGLIAGQSQTKKENKEKLLDIFRQAQNKKITNNDIEKLLGVSDATATRYLDELEKEEKIKQIGKTGQGVYYILK